MITRKRAVSTVSLGVLLALGCGVGCGSGSSGQADVAVRGSYEATTGGAYLRITFYDAQHYFLFRSPCDLSSATSANACLESGSYSLISGDTQIVLNDVKSGESTTLPFSITQVSSSLTAPTSLRTLGGVSLTNGDDAALTNGGDAALTSGGDAALTNGADAALTGEAGTALDSNAPLALTFGMGDQSFEQNGDDAGGGGGEGGTALTDDDAGGTTGGGDAGTAVGSDAGGGSSSAASSAAGASSGSGASSASKGSGAGSGGGNSGGMGGGGGGTGASSSAASSASSSSSGGVCTAGSGMPPMASCSTGGGTSVSVSMYYEGTCNFLETHSSYSKGLPAGEVTWGCTGVGACSDTDPWMAGPSRSYCTNKTGKQVTVCTSSGSCTVGTIRDISNVQGWEAGNAVMNALGLPLGTAKNITITY